MVLKDHLSGRKRIGMEKWKWRDQVDGYLSTGQMWGWFTKGSNNGEKHLKDMKYIGQLWLWKVKQKDVSRLRITPSSWHMHLNKLEYHLLSWEIKRGRGWGVPPRSRRSPLPFPSTPFPLLFLEQGTSPPALSCPELQVKHSCPIHSTPARTRGQFTDKPVDNLSPSR